ncbi:hypothetical protein LTR10_022950 [Elasticomyces elasticus]|uniref:F-box domain-containing protein n=1 Tax=Exophiala sideris TaxID=1016849 RepID=A0ABR0IYP1_9EURO|nr:hypothetical protein LTR10_022950 [Elasticomyces elasticus]KAK5022685.1 hypothetical protein LTS07_009908 [Exophiala sideris]KAK5027651.1 hypothetical protein LTR13_009358 [Exophiala sideris]KAK5052261.1 hypothetical protein LTR69_010023 [Exophiala sideris]KAK5177942.1 hypothetical protein LTR44_009491 [Eurotiomycetes sp. CCFEE 6388]
MGLNALPTEIFSRVIDIVLIKSTWCEGLRLRRVNRLWNLEIHAAYFDRRTLNTMDAKLDKLGVAHLYRYILGRISSQREQNQFYTNLRATVDLLSTIDLAWQEDARNKSFQGCPALKCKPPLEASASHSDVENLVAIGVLGLFCLLRQPTLYYLARVERHRLQMDPWSWAIVTAILLNNVPVVKVLLEGKPERDAYKNELLAEPLRLAITRKDYDIVTLLLENGAHQGCPSCSLPDIGGAASRTALERACVAGDVKMVEILRGPEYTSQTDCLTLDAAMQGTAAAIEKYRDQESSYVRIMECLVRTSDLEQQKELRAHAIYLGVSHQVKAIVLMVLGLGHDLNDHEFHSPLAQAASVGNLEIVELLLDNGATTSSGRNRDAVRSACLSANTDVLKLLFKRAITIPEYGHSLLASHLLYRIRESARTFSSLQETPGFNVDESCHKSLLELWKTCCHHGLDLTADNCGKSALGEATGTSFRLLREFLTYSMQSHQS